jgi:hypothetical protein
VGDFPPQRPERPDCGTALDAERRCLHLRR